MKKLFIAGALLLGLTSQAQFKNVNGELIWQKVFEGNKDDFTKNIIIHEAQDEGNYVTGFLNNIPNKFRDLGAKWGCTLIYAQNDITSADVLVEFKDGRYRITISNIYLSGYNSYSSVYLNDVAIKKDGSTAKHFFKQNCKAKVSAMQILSYSIEKGVKRNIINKNNW